MFKTITIFAALITFLLVSPVQADTSTESIYKGKGTLICTGGGGGKPLFNSECRQVSINRVTANGAIKYEITCTDSASVTFQMACDAYTLEQKAVVF